MHKKETLIKNVIKRKDIKPALARRFVDTDGTAYTCDGFRMYIERHTGEAPSEVPMAEPYPIESVKKILAGNSNHVASVMLPTTIALDGLKLAKALYKTCSNRRVSLEANGTLSIASRSAEFGDVKTTITKEDGYLHDGENIDKAAYDGRYLTEAIEFVAQKEDDYVCLGFAPIPNYKDANVIDGYAVTVDNGNGRSALVMGLHV